MSIRDKVAIGLSYRIFYRRILLARRAERALGSWKIRPRVGLLSLLRLAP